MTANHYLPSLGSSIIHCFQYWKLWFDFLSLSLPLSFLAHVCVCVCWSRFIRALCTSSCVFCLCLLECSKKVADRICLLLEIHVKCALCVPLFAPVCPSFCHFWNWRIPVIVEFKQLFPKCLFGSKYIWHNFFPLYRPKLSASRAFTGSCPDIELWWL